MNTNLYFLRHGLAEDRETWLKDDRLRPLTIRGKQLMQLEAETLVKLDLKINKIITSPLTRTVETAEIVCEVIGCNEHLIQDERLEPGFGFQDLQSLLQDYPDAGNILFVGHEPDFSETISELIGGGSLICKKGGLARVDLRSYSPVSGELVWLIPPKILAIGKS